MKCCLERKLIGEILVERGLITLESLNAALEYQKKTPKTFIGTILIQYGFLTEIDIVTALVLQCNLPYITISNHSIDSAVQCLIPVEMAHRSRLIPLDRIGNVLSVVMANPIDEVLRSEVEQVTGCNVAVFISTGAEIDRALEKYFSRNEV